MHPETTDCAVLHKYNTDNNNSNKKSLLTRIRAPIIMCALARVASLPVIYVNL